MSVQEQQVLQDSNSKLHSSVESWKRLHDGMQRDLDSANTAALEARHGATQSEAMVAVSQQLDEARSELDQQRAALDRSMAEREEVLQALRNETTTLHEQRGVNETLREELARVQQANVGLSDELECLQREVSQLGSRLGEDQRLHSELTELKSELEATRQRSQLAEWKLREDEEAHARELRSMQSELQTDINQIRETWMHEKFDAHETGERQRLELVAQLRAEEDKGRLLTEELHAERRNGEERSTETAQLRHELEAEKARVQQLQLEAQRAAASGGEALAGMQSRVADLQEQTRSLDSQRATEAASRSELQRRNEELLVELRTLGQQLADAKAAATASEELAMDRTALLERLATESTEKAGLSYDLKTTAQRLAAADDNCDELRSKLTDLEQEYETLRVQHVIEKQR